VQAGFAGKRSGEKQHCLAIAAIATLAYFSNLAISSTLRYTSALI